MNTHPRKFYEAVDPHEHGGKDTVVDIYFENCIYQNIEMNLPVSHWDKRLFLSTYKRLEVIGKHNFTDGQDVTGKYEVKYQVFPVMQQEWINEKQEIWNLVAASHRRIIAVALPTVPKEQPEDSSRTAMGEEKTAMQELIDYLVSQKKQFEPMAYGFLMHRCITLLEKEKEQIIEAYKSGGKSFSDIDYTTMVMDKEATEYFTQTYKL